MLTKLSSVESGCGVRALLRGAPDGGETDGVAGGWGQTEQEPLSPWRGRILSVMLRASLALAVAAAGTTLAGPAQARSIIKQPGNHPDYSVELEPHLVMGWAGFDHGGFDPTDIHLGGPMGLGPGLRLSIPLVENGFLRRANNNVALGFGVDWAHYSSSNAGVWWFPVVMQWNFFLADFVTLFGEPGITVRHAAWQDHGTTAVRMVLQGGAKFMFTDRFGLTVRVGAPYMSVGLSFLL